MVTTILLMTYRVKHCQALHRQPLALSSQQQSKVNTFTSAVSFLQGCFHSTESFHFFALRSYLLDTGFFFAWRCCSRRRLPWTQTGLGIRQQRGVALRSEGPSEAPAAAAPDPPGAGGRRAARPRGPRPAQRAPLTARLGRARRLRAARRPGAHERARLPRRARHAALRLLQLRAPQAVHRGAEPGPRVRPRHAGLQHQLLQPAVAHVPHHEAVRPLARAPLRAALRRRGGRAVVPVLAVTPAAAAPGLQPHRGLPGARCLPAAAAAAAASPRPGPGLARRRPLRPQPDARRLPQRPAALAAAARGGQRAGPAQGCHPRGISKEGQQDCKDRLR